MAKLPGYRRIMKQDYAPDEQNFVEKLAVSINNGFETIYDALNKKLTLSENISSTVKDIDLEVDSTGKPSETTVFTVDFDGKVALIMIGKLDNLTNSQVFPTQAPFITYRQSDKNVTIQHVTGLQTGYVYRLKIVAFKE